MTHRQGKGRTRPAEEFEEPVPGAAQAPDGEHGKPKQGLRGRSLPADVPADVRPDVPKNRGSTVNLSPPDVRPDVRPDPTSGQFPVTTFPHLRNPSGTKCRTPSPGRDPPVPGPAEVLASAAVFHAPHPSLAPPQIPPELSVPLAWVDSRLKTPLEAVLKALDAIPFRLDIHNHWQQAWDVTCSALSDLQEMKRMAYDLARGQSAQPQPVGMMRVDGICHIKSKGVGATGSRTEFLTESRTIPLRKLVPFLVRRKRCLSSSRCPLRRFLLWWNELGGENWDKLCECSEGCAVCSLVSCDLP